MGMTYVALESIQNPAGSPEPANHGDQTKANFTNYETWAKEIAATASSLNRIPTEHAVKGIYPVNEVGLQVKTITALNKMLKLVLSKREALDFTKVSGIENMEKVGIKAGNNILDDTNYREGVWRKTQVKGPVQLKSLGWSGSKAVQFAKALQTELSNVGTYQSFVTARKAITEPLTKNARTSMKDRKRFSLAARQITHLLKIRHKLIVDTYGQFISLKKTI